MKIRAYILLFLLLAVGLLSGRAQAAILYVDLNSSNATPPYASWSTAATSIQDAVDAAVDGDQIWVTDGNYQTGGRVADGAMTNRVAITKSITVRSVNGPAVTIISGYQVPGGALGDASIRCALLKNGAVLSGFTLTNGASRSDFAQAFLDRQGGGALSPDNSGVLTNCILTGNVGLLGGGAVLCTMNDCIITNNYAWEYGGGVNGCTVSNCVISGNTSSQGGGAVASTLIRCVVNGNSAGSGGGATSCDLENCRAMGNSAYDGGGAQTSSLNNCVLSGNSAVNLGGGAHSSIISHCTIVGNFAGYGGGTATCPMDNSIIYYNQAVYGTNDYNSTCDFCCMTPLPSDGANNFTMEPQLADAFHLSATSPCRGAGTAGSASGTDIDGEIWASTPSIGCDEFQAGSITGPLSVLLQADLTNVAVGYTVNLTATMTGHGSHNRWDFGDGTFLTNSIYAAHSWAAAGNYSVVMTVFNDSNPGGVSATQLVHVVDGNYYVAIRNATPAAPYTTWATAATNIQDAIDAAATGGTVHVSNGVYQTGGRVVYSLLTNRVALIKPLLLKSVNGPAVTIIQGYQMPVDITGDAAVRCVYITNGAVISGFTISNGSTRTLNCECYDGGTFRGGGVWCESAVAVVTNCVITGCAASDSGAGVFGGTLYNCQLLGNHADDTQSGYGGGAESATLNNCELSGNSANAIGGGADNCWLNNCIVFNNTTPGNGGGACGCTVNNCVVVGNYAGNAYGGAGFCTVSSSIVVSNASPSGPNYGGSLLDHCCTTPMPDSGLGNITNDPAFINFAGGNYRLQANSPCINGGNNLVITNNTDYDGNVRVVGWTVDIGAFEFQSPTTLLSYAWAQQYGLPTDGSADFLDTDHDGMNNWQEWKAGTNPTDATSVLKMLPPIVISGGVTITWQSVSNVTYYLQRSSNLAVHPAFSTLQSNIVGQAVSTSYNDPVGTNSGFYFYRVGVQ